MKVLVLGAGVIGTASAWYLAKAGHDVTVIDRQPGPGLETSFANAGGVCPSFAGPWAAPGMPLKVARWMLAAHAPLMLRPRLDRYQWKWLSAFVRNCTSERFALNKTRMQRIAHYSQACLIALRDDIGIAYDQGTGGVLQIFRTQEDVDGGVRAAKVLTEFGIPHRIADRDEVCRIEPALKMSAVPIAGGLHLPLDETGDCHLFTDALMQASRRRGVSFLFDTIVKHLLVVGGAVTGVVTDKGTMQADVTVVALGSEATFLLRPHGIDLPIYPVKGYSVTLRIDDDDSAPRSSVMDEHSKVMITRLGDRIRAAGAAEVSGYDRVATSRQCDAIEAVARSLFPAASSGIRLNDWAGLRPMTPDGPPYLGRTRIKNLILNVGQGSNGWTQACGCGQIVADIISGRDPQIDLEGFGVESVERN